MVVFMSDFRDASLGPHGGLHITALAALRSDERLGAHPADTLAALGTRQDRSVLSLHLWNDTVQVVACKGDNLGLQPALCSADFAKDSTEQSYKFRSADGTELVVGKWPPSGGQMVQ